MIKNNIKNNRLLHVFILIFLSSMFLSIMTVAMNDIDTLQLLESIFGTICVTMIWYWLLTKIGTQLHIDRKVKIVLIAIIFVAFGVFAIANIFHFQGESLGVARYKFIRLGTFRIDKYNLASSAILCVFPVFSELVTDVMKVKKDGAKISVIILLIMQMIVNLSLFGLRLATMIIVTFINTVIACYMLKNKYDITNEKMNVIIAGFGLVIAGVLFSYFVLYPDTVDISVSHYWDEVADEIGWNLFNNSPFLGMNVSKDFLAPYYYYDCMSPMIVTLLLFGWGPYILTVLLAVVMAGLIIKIVITVCKSAVHDVKKIITVAMAVHILLQIIMSILMSLGIPVIPINFPFYIQHERHNYHFTYTVSGYGDIAIMTSLIMIYLGIPRKSKDVEESSSKKEVEKDESVCK